MFLNKIITPFSVGDMSDTLFTFPYITHMVRVPWKASN